MPWFKVDDVLPRHRKAKALRRACGDDHCLLAAAWMTWLHVGCECAASMTDGKFDTADALHAVHLPPELVMRALAVLADAGFLRYEGAEYAFHDWGDYQPSRAAVAEKREELSQKRSEAGRRGAEARWGTDGKMAKPMATQKSVAITMPKANRGRGIDAPMIVPAVTHRKTSQFKAKSASVATRRDDGPVPSRPVLNQKAEENTTCSRSGGDSDAPIPPRTMNPDNPPPSNTRGAPVPNAKSPDAQLTLLGDPATPSRAPSDAHSGAGSAPNASMPVATTPAPRKQASRAAAKPKAVKEKAPEDAMPFTVMAALQAIEAAANGRFVVGHYDDWPTGTFKNVTRQVKKFRDITRWTLVGEWLAAEGNTRGSPLTPDWAGGKSLNAAMIGSRDWHEKGRAPRVGNRPFVSKTSAISRPLPVARDEDYPVAGPDGRCESEDVFDDERTRAVVVGLHARGGR